MFAFPKSKLWLTEILVTLSSKQVVQLSNKISLMIGFCMTSAGVPSQFYCKLLVTLKIVSEDGALHFPGVSSRLCFPCLFVKGSYAVDGEASQTLQFETRSFFRMLLNEWCHFNQGIMQVFQGNTCSQTPEPTPWFGNIHSIVHLPVHLHFWNTESGLLHLCCSRRVNSVPNIPF